MCAPPDSSASSCCRRCFALWQHSSTWEDAAKDAEEEDAWVADITGGCGGALRARTAEKAVGLVGVHHVHWAVHTEHHPGRHAAVDPLQVPLQPLRQ